MKKLKTAALAVCMLFAVLVLSIQAAPLNNLNFTATGGEATSSGGTYTLTAKEGSASMRADISKEVKALLGETGGTLAIRCQVSVTGNEEACSVDMTCAGITQNEDFSQNGGSKNISLSKIKISAEDAAESSFSLSFKGSGLSEGSKITVRSIELTGTPAEVTPSPSSSPSDGGESTPTPTATPTVSPTPSHTAPSTPNPTAQPTKKPGVSYEPTKDTWTNNGKVTNAPPTPPVDIGNIDDISTPVAESTPEPQNNSGMTSGSSINKGLIILFSVLILLLGADIAAIFIRKRYAPASLSSGALSVHRNIHSDSSDEVPTDAEYDYDLEDED